VGARRGDRLAETAAMVTDLGRKAVCCVTDVSDPDACRRLASAAADLGRVAALVNNAGIASAVPASGETPDQFRSVLDVNLAGSYPDGYVDGLLAGRPIPRPGRLDELTAAVLFLASSASGYITGQTLVVDGLTIS
jgi:NAD(P)-dependent dehydrogenase (short-subunit alcohol dehydrogenase family)